MDSPSPLVALPQEVLQLIIENVHASAHWPLAQTCKHIYANSQAVLDLHRRAYRTLRICSDIGRLTVPNLLWSVFGHGVDSIEAWHVRQFEVWNDRECRGEEVLCPFYDDDIDHFCNNLLEIPECLPSSFYRDAREEIERNGDVLLKSLLIAHLPRLKVLRYAQPGRAELLSLKYLCGFIPYSLAAGALLPGFESLERVAIGIMPPPDSWETPEPPARSPDELLALMCLPNLSELYFSDLDGNFILDKEFTELYPYDSEPPFGGISPVRTIILDNLRLGFSEKLMDVLARTPRGLENLIIDFDNSNDEQSEDPQRTHSLVKRLSEHQRLSLQRLHISCRNHHHYVNWPINSIRLDRLSMFRDLREVTLCWEWVEDSLNPAGIIRSRSKLLERLCDFMENNLPATMEIIILSGFPQSDKGSVFLEGAFGEHSALFLDDAFAAMIASPRYENLKAVFLEAFLDGLLNETNFKEGDDGLDFPRTRDAAHERGVLLGLPGEDPLPELKDYMPSVPSAVDMVTIPGLEELQEALGSPREVLKMRMRTWND